MSNIKQLRARLWELAMLVNQAKGEEKQRLTKEKVWQQYDKMRKQRW